MHLAIWLLVSCTGYAGYEPCDVRSGVNSTIVTEAQCNAVLSLEIPKTNMWCIAPDGRVTAKTASKRLN
jgi:hypothetical protein